MRWGSLIVVFGPLVSATTKLITNFESMSTTNPEFPGTVTVGRQIRESLMGHYLTTSIHHVAGIFRYKIYNFEVLLLYTLCSVALNLLAVALNLQ